jgi:hypothetical protein
MDLLHNNKGDLNMKQIKWLFLLFAILACACMVGIGISIAERSNIGIITCIVATVAVFGIGFSSKKKLLGDQ